MVILETRWGQGLSAAYFPKENVIPFSRVRIARPTLCELEPDTNFWTIDPIHRRPGLLSRRPRLQSRLVSLLPAHCGDHQAISQNHHCRHHRVCC